MGTGEEVLSYFLIWIFGGIGKFFLKFFQSGIRLPCKRCVCLNKPIFRTTKILIPTVIGAIFSAYWFNQISFPNDFTINENLNNDASLLILKISLYLVLLRASFSFSKANFIDKKMVIISSVIFGLTLEALTSFLLMDWLFPSWNSTEDKILISISLLGISWSIITQFTTHLEQNQYSQYFIQFIQAHHQFTPFIVIFAFVVGMRIEKGEKVDLLDDSFDFDYRIRNLVYIAIEFAIGLCFAIFFGLILWMFRKCRSAVNLGIFGFICVGVFFVSHWFEFINIAFFFVLPFAFIVIRAWKQQPIHQKYIKILIDFLWFGFLEVFLFGYLGVVIKFESDSVSIESIYFILLLIGIKLIINAMPPFKSKLSCKDKLVLSFTNIPKGYLQAILPSIFLHLGYKYIIQERNDLATHPELSTPEVLVELESLADYYHEVFGVQVRFIVISIIFSILVIPIFSFCLIKPQHQNIQQLESEGAVPETVINDKNKRDGSRDENENEHNSEAEREANEKNKYDNNLHIDLNGKINARDKKIRKIPGQRSSNADIDSDEFNEGEAERRNHQSRTEERNDNTFPSVAEEEIDIDVTNIEENSYNQLSVIIPFSQKK